MFSTRGSTLFIRDHQILTIIPLSYYQLSIINYPIINYKLLVNAFINIRRYPPHLSVLHQKELLLFPHTFKLPHDL